MGRLMWICILTMIFYSYYLYFYMLEVILKFEYLLVFKKTANENLNKKMRDFQI